MILAAIAKDTFGESGGMDGISLVGTPGAWILLVGLISAFLAYLLLHWILGETPAWLEPTHASRLRPSLRDRQRIWLSQAGSKATPEQFALMLAGLAIVTYAGVRALTDVTSVSIAGAAIMTMIPWFQKARQRRLQLREVQYAWPDALQDLVTELRAGEPVHEAMRKVAEAGPVALRKALAGYERLYATYGFRAAISILRERIADPSTDRVLDALLVADERGAEALLPALEILARAAGKDLEVSRKIESETFMMRLSAWVGFAIPWGIVVAYAIGVPQYREFFDSSTGSLWLYGAMVVSLLGMWGITRLARVPVEPRPFAASAAQGARP